MPDAQFPPIPLARVIAIVGSDGAGKSTLMADLAAEIGRDHEVASLYLGQGSGNILSGIKRLPLVGAAIGRFLKRRGERAHGKDGAPAPPDVPTALVVHLLSRRRLAAFRRMLALHRDGAVVIADRWPQAEVPGFYFDGPGLAVDAANHPIVRRLAAREGRLYRGMARHHPALVIRLNIDAETAQARKPDHKLSMLREKARVIPTLAFDGATILDLDARAPYPEVRAAAIAAAREALRLPKT